MNQTSRIAAADVLWLGSDKDNPHPLAGLNVDDGEKVCGPDAARRSLCPMCLPENMLTQIICGSRFVCLPVGVIPRRRRG